MNKKKRENDESLCLPHSFFSHVQLDGGVEITLSFTHLCSLVFLRCGKSHSLLRHRGFNCGTSCRRICSDESDDFGGAFARAHFHLIERS